MAIKDQMPYKMDMHELVKDNRFLFVLVGIGTGVLLIGVAIGSHPPYHEIFIALGAALIIASAVAIYMMATTRQVAKNLHERFNELTQTLKENHVETTGLLKKMDGSLTNMTVSMKNMAVAITNMAVSQENMAVSLENVASSQKDIITILKRIDSKMKPDS